MSIRWRQRASTTRRMDGRRAFFVVYVMVVTSFLASGFLGLFEAEADPGPVEDVVCLVESVLPDHPVVPECPSPSPTEATPTQTVVSDPPCAFEPEGCESPSPSPTEPTPTTVTDPPCAFEPEGCATPTPKKTKKPKPKP